MKLNALLDEVFLNHTTMGAATLVRTHMDALRAEKRLSFVHDWDHTEAVARYAAVIAAAIAEGLGLCDEDVLEVAKLSALAGIFHDAVREKTEATPHGPASAEFFYKWGHSKMSTFHAEAICRAIREHEGPFGTRLALFGDPVGIVKTKGSVGALNPDKLVDLKYSIVGVAVKTADGLIEASGYRVIARRAGFVSGERLLHTDGDLHKIENLLKDPNAPEWAFVGESLIRLYSKLKLDDFPIWLRSLAEELHSGQYVFLSGLLRHLGQNEVSAAKMLLSWGFTKFDEKLVEAVEKQRHLSGRWFRIEEHPNICRIIAVLNSLTDEESADLATSTSEVVRMFSAAALTSGIAGGCEALGRTTRGGWLGTFRDGILAGNDVTTKIHSYVAGGVASALAA
jgi:hypothetical protein